jgi:hypothetical protein
MTRLAIGVLVLACTTAANAQRVPGRDLLTYPLGLTGEAAAFGSGPASGLWNPATAILGNGERYRLGAAALSAPIDLALSGQVFHGAMAVRSLGTVSLSFTHAAVTDLLHTETDPQSIGDEVPYHTLITSLAWARRMQTHLVIGAAARWHTGQVQGRSGSAFVTDAGVLVDHLTSRDARVACSTFLWTFDGADAPVLSAAADIRVAGADTLHDVRAGAAYERTRGRATESYPYVEARFGKFILRGGPVRIDAYSNATWHLRIAAAVRHAGYTLAVAREENESGLSPTYQLSIANVIR